MSGMLIDPEICSLCPKGHVVQTFGLGPPDADVMVITNRKSSAKYQLVLEQQLTEAGLDPRKVRITPVLKCSDYDTTLTNKQLKAHAEQYLWPEIERANPKYILALGNEALIATTGKTGIMKQRGHEFPSKVGKAIVMATISPSAVNRNPGQLPGYMADLRLFGNMVNGKTVGIKDPKYLVADTKAKLDQMLRILDMTDEIYIDIETNRGEYYEVGKGAAMVSLAATCVITKPDGTKGRTVFALPLFHPESPWRTAWQQVLRLMGKHCKGIRKVVAHNSSFDCKWLITSGVKLYPTFDTMLAVHLLDENVAKGLKPQAMSRLGVPPWGIDTGDLLKTPLAEVLHYNVLDTWYMYWIKQQLADELKKQPRLARIFRFETMPAQRELIDSEIRGVWIDVPVLKKRLPEAEQRLETIEAKIRKAAALPEFGSDEWPKDARGKPLAENFNASIFARWMLFDWCGLPVLERGKAKPDGSKGDPSMAEHVLMALVDKHPAVEFMLERVTAQKHLSSFFKPYSELYDEDHRIHTTFKLAGTVTGRLSSGKSDADKVSGSRGKLRGVNMQQVPRDPFIKGMFGAPPGWTFVESDYSQVELRVAAFLADEQNMKHIYETGGDIHRSTAARVTGLPESEVSGKVRKEVGKPVNFGFLYGMGTIKFIATAFSNYGAVFTEAESKAARKAYFDLYPALLPWHAKQRRLVNQYGRVESPLGRIRHLPDVYSPDPGVRAEAERQAINSPVQGFASDLAVISMVVINQRFREQGIAGHCLGLVHDAINYEIRDDHLAWALPIIKDTMEDMDIVYKKFGTVVDIPIVADVAVGRHWGDKTELTPDQVYDFKLEYRQF
jgi:DNA polymerase I-like protein with 3'-5' exonuclease and polymerase domains